MKPPLHFLCVYPVRDTTRGMQTSLQAYTESLATRLFS